MTDDKLNWKDAGSLAVEAAVSALPYIGGPLQTAYFGAKNERRFKRVESFYKNLQKEIEDLRKQVASEDTINQYSDQITDFMEKINDIVETDSGIAKRSLLHNAFLNVMVHTGTIDWSKLDYFLFIIKQLDLTDVNILVATYQLPPDRWGVLTEYQNVIQADKFYILGVLERLVSFGIIEKRLGDINLASSGTKIATYYRMTELGNSFVAFVLEPPEQDETSDDQQNPK